MKTSSNKDFDYAMLPLKILAWPVGTWPLQKYNFSSAMRTIITLIILMVMMMIVNLEIYLDVNDAEKNLDALVLIGCGILAVWKVACFRICSDSLVTNFSSAVKDYNDLSGEDKRAIVRRHAYMGRMACASLIGFSYMSATLFTSVPMLAADDETVVQGDNVTQNNTPDYPIPSELTMKVLHVPESMYLVIFVTEYAMLLVTSTGNLGSDGLFFGITFHLCGQAEVLKLEFSKFVDESDNKTERLNALTIRHRHLLKLSEKLNNIISSILIIQLSTSCLLICTTGFQCILSVSVHNLVMVVKTFIVMSTVLTQLFAYSYVGDYLKNQMEGIGYSAYCSSWYNIPSNISRDIVFILMRAQTPVYLKAGQFFVVNMETYMSIVKTSMSYLSVLRVMITT
ncbi:odorant receptor 10-like [Ptiloglossa arizonensis]|uniref:odorant receptor 10-like n=1 Tax=Ptiloglossa arizonensis TaxID=3350558 RepID=UPI003F9EBEA4